MSYVPVSSLFETLYNIIMQIVIMVLFSFAVSYNHHFEKAKTRKLGRLLESLGLENIEEQKKPRTWLCFSK